MSDPIPVTRPVPAEHLPGEVARLAAVVRGVHVELHHDLRTATRELAHVYLRLVAARRAGQRAS